MLRLAGYTLAAAVALALGGCQETGAPPNVRPSMSSVLDASAAENGKYIVVFTGDDAPDDFEARVVARGGTIDEIMTGAGLAIISGLSEAGAADLASTDGVRGVSVDRTVGDRKSTRLNSSHSSISYAVFCLKKKKKTKSTKRMRLNNS